MRKKILWITVWVSLAGLLQADERVKFWEWPYPEPAVIVPELETASQAQPINDVERLDFLVELKDGNTRKQWIVSVGESGTETQPVPDMQSDSFYCSTGDVFEFQSVVQPLRLRTLGPAIMKTGKLSRRSKPDQSVEEEVMVPKDFLLLGFDQLADFTLKIPPKDKLEMGLQIRTEPFPPEVVAETRARFETLGIGTEQIRSIVGLAPSLNSFFNLLMGTPGVRDILMEVVDKPSALSVLTKGFQLNFRAGREGVAVEDPLDWGLEIGTPCYRVPITIELNGHDAVYALLFVRSADMPYALTAGVVGIIAYKPDEPDRVLTVRLRYP